MDTIGVFNSAQGAEADRPPQPQKGFLESRRRRALYEQSARARRNADRQGRRAGLAETGVHTGRSPKDKFVVRDEATETAVWWDNNGSMTPGQFDILLADFLEHAEGKELFVQDLLRRRRSVAIACGRASSPNMPGTRSSSATC